jgi:hypothetical protein
MTDDNLYFLGVERKPAMPIFGLLSGFELGDRFIIKIEPGFPVICLYLFRLDYSDFQMNRPQCSNHPTASSDEIC